MPVFVFTDIEGSTGLWERFGAAMAAALERHDRIITTAVAAHGGRILKHTGDGFLAVFDAGDPVACALEIQCRIAAEDWPSIGELRLRVAVHAGAAQEREGDFFGPAVNLAARLRDAAWGGQILLTDTLAGRLPPGAELVNLGVHTLRDLAEPIRVHQLHHPDLPRRDFPPLRSGTARFQNLPPQPTAFVGRDRELAAIIALLRAPDCRLVTLHGPGGTGKTRLALAAAAAVADEFEWGAFFAPLAPLAAAEQIPATVAAAIGFPFSNPRDLKGQLFGYLQGKNALAVIDNAEHLMPAAAAFTAELMAAAPDLKVLVTSRERLALRTENVYAVAGVATPVDGPDWGTYTAVRLFEEAAGRLTAGYTIAPDERPAFVRLCAGVAGSPLALELAAPWTRLLSLDEIVGELTTDFDLLGDSSADAPARHRGLRAVFEYSFHLLTAAERERLIAASVFAGGFTREAGQAVAGMSLPVLDALVGKSLIRRDGEGRYALHEVTRQYAAAKLAADDERRSQVEAAFADYFLAFARDQGLRLVGANQIEALAAFSADIANLRAARRFILARGDPEELAVFAAGLYPFLELTNLYDEATAFLEAASAAAEKAAAERTGPAADRARAAWGRLLVNYARCFFARQMVADSVRLARRSVALAHKYGMPDDVASALMTIAGNSFLAGRMEAGRRQLETARRIFQSIGNRTGEGSALINLGILASVRGEYEAAKKYYDLALTRFREIGDGFKTAKVLANLGNLEFDSGRKLEALRLLRESLAAVRAVGFKTGILNRVQNLGVFSAAAGLSEDAEGYFEEGIELARELNSLPDLVGNLAHLGELLADRGDLERAKVLLAEANDLADRTSLPAVRAEARISWAEVLAAEGRKAAADETLVEGLRAALASGIQRLLVLALQKAARHLRAARPAKALEIYAALAGTPYSAAEDDHNNERLDSLRRELAAEDYERARAEGAGRTLKEAAEDAARCLAAGI